MFYEEFSFKEEDNLPTAEYKADDLKIIYYMVNVSDGRTELASLITHEWLHGLIDWATGNTELVDEHGDHFILKLINFD